MNLFFLTEGVDEFKQIIDLIGLSRLKSLSLSISESSAVGVMEYVASNLENLQTLSIAIRARELWPQTSTLAVVGTAFRAFRNLQTIKLSPGLFTVVVLWELGHIHSLSSIQLCDPQSFDLADDSPEALEPLTELGRRILHDPKRLFPALERLQLTTFPHNTAYQITSLFTSNLTTLELWLPICQRNDPGCTPETHQKFLAFLSELAQLQVLGLEFFDALGHKEEVQIERVLPLDNEFLHFTRKLTNLEELSIYHTAPFAWTEEEFLGVSSSWAKMKRLRLIDANGGDYMFPNSHLSIDCLVGLLMNMPGLKFLAMGFSDAIPYDEPDLAGYDITACKLQRIDLLYTFRDAHSSEAEVLAGFIFKVIPRSTALDMNDRDSDFWERFGESVGNSDEEDEEGVYYGETVYYYTETVP